MILENFKKKKSDVLWLFLFESPFSLIAFWRALYLLFNWDLQNFNLVLVIVFFIISKYSNVLLEAYVTKNYKLDKETKKKKKELEELVRELNTYTEPVPDLRLHTPELIKT